MSRYLKKLQNITGNNITISVIVLSLIFPIIAWISEMEINHFSCTFRGILHLHHSVPALFIIDFIPVLAGIVTYIFTQKNQFVQLKFEKNIKQIAQEREKNAWIAQQIGKGNYSIEIQNGQNDLLSQSFVAMRDNLLANSQKEKEQKWIAEGKEIIANILRIHSRLEDLAYDVIVNLIKYIKVTQGAMYIYDEDHKTLTNIATYAYNRRKYVQQEFKIGQGLVGECGYEMDSIYRTEIPDDYVSITSGILGDQKPQSLLIIPLISDEKLQGVLEFASLEPEITKVTRIFLKELGEIIARTISNLQVNQRTEKLLQESQQMTEELQENEEELRQSAEEMRATQEELEFSNKKLESQVLEVENAQKRLHSLLENASEIISIYDKELKVTFISPSVKKILGFSSEEMIKGKNLERLTSKGESDLKAMLHTLLEKPQETQTLQYSFLKSNGDKIFLECTGRNLLNGNAIHGIILNSRDITERKRAEKEERMRTKMQSLSENSLDMIIRLNTSGIFYYSNPVVEDYIGLKPADLAGRTIKDKSIPAVFSEYFEETTNKIKNLPKKTNTQLIISLKAGEKTMNRFLSIDAIPEFNESELETILFIGHDITETKRIEQEIQGKNRKIEDSINYAQHIQSSILPDTRLIQKYLPKSFMYYKPRDVVSGDFPWFFAKDNDLYLAVVDCTGHGVPGALLSFVGYFILNNIVDHPRDLTAAEVCDMLHKGVRTTLKQDRLNADARDGMDLALCKINLAKQEMHFAGAHRPLYHVRNNELTEYKGDRKAIGGIPNSGKPEADFTDHLIKLMPGDKIFFFSDGLTDQLGGPKLKKYSPQRVRENILTHNSYSMEEYNNLFAKDFDEWQGKTKQIDDVLLIGIEF